MVWLICDSEYKNLFSYYWKLLMILLVKMICLCCPYIPKFFVLQHFFNLMIKGPILYVWVDQQVFFDNKASTFVLCLSLLQLQSNTVSLTAHWQHRWCLGYIYNISASYLLCTNSAQRASNLQVIYGADKIGFAIINESFGEGMFLCFVLLDLNALLYLLKLLNVIRGKRVVTNESAKSHKSYALNVLYCV